MTTTCQWFLLCTRPATLTRDHPILGKVPICAECNAKVSHLDQINQMMPERTRDLTPEEMENLAYWLVDKRKDKDQ